MHEPGGPAPAHARLFIALWPGPQVRRRLLDWRAACDWPAGARPVRAADLHLTLHFIGRVPVERLPELVDGLAVPFRRFELHFGRAEVWGRGTAVLHPRTAPQRLVELHAQLRQALVRLGLPVEQRSFRPHVTLARDARGARLAGAAPAWRWSVHGYVLAQSRPGSAGGYRVLWRYR